VTSNDPLSDARYPGSSPWATAVLRAKAWRVRPRVINCRRRSAPLDMADIHEHQLSISSPARQDALVVRALRDCDHSSVALHRMHVCRPACSYCFRQAARYVSRT
jgi:hypothetical protein